MMCQGNPLCQIPLQMSNLKNEKLDIEIIRSSIIAELNAINYFEQLSMLTKNDAIKHLLLTIIKGKKHYIEALQALLLSYDEQKIKDDKKAESQSLWNMC
jgi:rubrerythrin